MAVPRSLANLVTETARQKLAAAKARRNPNVDAEKPREAIFDALQIVREAIGAQGYSFTPSGPRFSRKHGDFTFEIRIQSDRNNVAGQRAAIWAHAGVYSKSLNAWRKKHSSEWIKPKSPLPISVFSNQLGHLCDPPGWVEWDFADNANRRSIAHDLTASIRNGAFPLFATFEGPPEAIAALADQDWPPPEGILSYLLSTGHVAQANETLRNYLGKRPAYKRDFEHFYHQFLGEGLPSHRAGASHDLAAFAVATGLTSNGG